MKKDAPKKPPLLVVSDAQALEDRIRERAYELYQERGQEDGHALAGC